MKILEIISGKLAGYLARRRYRTRQKWIDYVIQVKYPRPKDRISQGFRDNVEREIYGDLLPNPDK